MPRFLLGIAIFSAFLLAATDAPTTYSDSIKAWQKHRDEGLRSPNGWLTLVGLFWLKPGDNTIGSAASNDFVLPKGSAPEHIGRLHLAGDKVSLIDAAGAEKPLSYDDDKPDIVTAGTVSFFAIQRLDKIGIRAKDSASPVLKNFTGMKYFPINPAMHFAAKLIPDVKKVPILNVLGQTEMQESPGWVEFSYQGHAYRLRPIYEDTANGKTLFFVFNDSTSKRETYQAGRMLNMPLPVDGKVELDFNRAYNPPCVFTPYATCPLPPRENHLPIRIEAGELRYGSGHAGY